MKKIVFLLLLIPIIGFSQEKPKELTYTDVVKVDSLVTAKQLYINAKSWFAESYKNSKYVIQLEDKEEGKIIGNGSFPYRSNIFIGNAASVGYINYTITIYVKDGRYKYEIANIIHEGASTSFGKISDLESFIKDKPSKGWRTKVFNDLKTQIDDYFNVLINELKSYMLKASSINNDKW